MTVRSVEVRRIIVAHLTDRHMSVAEIADELGVSRETVRRDRLNPPPAVDEDEARAKAKPALTAKAAFGLTSGPQGLTLPPSDQLGRDLRRIAWVHRRPAADVVEEMIRWHSKRLRERWLAQQEAEQSAQAPQ
ncbi:helix-turn-helix domain-containing protein [Streptomyces sp. NPDC102381]|uniref:helix-turn-helix domain-containing protein n=1 Tax=Streptomyces sp. NPDC102381 TaxID=3366164 RepID=UPI003822CA67